MSSQEEPRIISAANEANEVVLVPEEGNTKQEDGRGNTLAGQSENEIKVDQDSNAEDTKDLSIENLPKFDLIGDESVASSSSYPIRLFQPKNSESISRKHFEEVEKNEKYSEASRVKMDFIRSTLGEVVPFQLSSCSTSIRNIKNANSGATSTKTFKDMLVRRTDTFLPIRTDEDRKMLGISDIPLFPNGKYSFLSTDMREQGCSTPSSMLSNLNTPSHGGGDADMWDAKSLSSSEEAHDNDSSVSHSSLKIPGMKKKGMNKRVCFSVYDDDKDEKSLRSSIFRKSNSRKSGLTNSSSTDDGTVAIPVETQSTIAQPSDAERDDQQFFSKTDTFSRYVRSLSVQSLKSKKLETKLQQDMRVAFFDLEAQRASEDWKFRKSVEALDLEYRKKLLNLVENHNTFQKRLQGRFFKQISKIRRKLKKEANEGRLNEGNCFNVSQSIDKFLAKI